METVIRIKLKDKEKLFLPFYNEWNKNVYTFDKPFEFSPCTITACSTSGAPIVVGENFVVGFLNDCDGKFVSNGEYLEVLADSASDVFYCEAPAKEAIAKYQEAVIPQFPQNEQQDFWSEVEYCTWVEQVNAVENVADREKKSVLSDEFVKRYLDRLEKLNFKKGKFTIDAGWNVNWTNGYGDFYIDEKLFPHMDETIKYIADAGYKPGIWLSPALICNQSKMFKQVEQYSPEYYRGGEDDSGIGRLQFQKVNDIFKEHYYKIIKNFIDMGVKKFKIDIYYGNKRDMKENLKYVYETVKALDKTVEVECHIPDPFVSQYCDVVRMNDVVLRDGVDWYDLTKAHYDVCRISSPHKIINLDHIGGNNINISEEFFLAHLEQMKDMKGHKVISYLPDKYSEKAIEIIRNSL